MNSRKTNIFVTVLNIVLLIFACIICLWVKDSWFYMSIARKSAYNNFIIDTVLNYKLIYVKYIPFFILGITSIVLAIQNKENKKLCFWQVIFFIFEVWLAISIYIDNCDFNTLVDIIICGIIPLLFIIVNYILSKKHKVKLNVIPYVLLTIFSILVILGTKLIADIFNYGYMYIIMCWNVIAILMQLKYIYYQDKNVTESSKRKKFNIIYYVLELLLIVLFIFIFLYLFFIINVKESIWNKEFDELYKNVTSLQGGKIKEIYIPVFKNNKYGFINEKGEEKIPCEYDIVTNFFEVNYNEDIYYMSLVKRNNEYYIISKSNNSITIEKNLKKYIGSVENQALQSSYNMMSVISWEDITRSFLFYGKYRRNLIGEQTLQKKEKEISLIKNQSKYYYKNKNYLMFIEPLDEGNENDDLDLNTRLFVDDNIIKCSVTIKKLDGEQNTDTVYIQGLNIDGESATIKTLSDGYIKFIDEKVMYDGWYNGNGDQKKIPDKYELCDINNGNIILYDEDKQNNVFESQYIIMSNSNKVLLRTTELDIYDNVYVVRKNNDKQVLMDNKMNTISNEYDDIGPLM